MDIDKIEKKLNHYAQKIIVSGSKIDEYALGELSFYMALRRIYEHRSTIQDLGMMDAINDTLQEAGIIRPQDTFYKVRPQQTASSTTCATKPKESRRTTQTKTSSREC